MDSTTKEMIVPSQGGRIPQGTADEPSTVPARPLSSSNEGLTEVLALDTSRNMDTGNDEPRHDQGHEKENGKDNEGKDEDVGANEAVEDDSSMDMVVCRKRIRDRSSETEKEEEIKPSQKIRKPRIKRDEESEEAANKNQEPSASPIYNSDGNENVRIISLYEEGVYVGDEEDEDHRKEKKRGRGRPKKERRKVVGVQDLDVHELSDSEDSEGFNVTSAAEAGARALEYLDAVDQIRVKSKNIKGNLSGMMKKRLKDSKEIVRALMRKAEKSGDKTGKEKESEKEIEIKMLKTKNKELETRLKEKEREGKAREEEVEQLQKIVFDMKKEIDRLKGKIENLEQKQQKQVVVKEDSPKRKKVKSKRDTYLDGRAIYLENRATTEESTAWEESDVPEKGKMDYRHTMEFRRSPKERSAHDPRPPEMVEDPQHLKQKKMSEIQATREKLKSTGTIGNVGQERDQGGSSEMTEWPALPQRKTREFRSSIRKDIKVLSNVRLASKVKVIPPSLAPKEEGGQQEEWKVVKGRKEIRNEKKTGGQAQEQQQQRRKDMKQGVRRRPPRSAAITIRGVKENFSFADALRKARDNPEIKEIGIENTRLRKTAMGNVLIEIVGEKEKREEKAEKLAHALQQLLITEAKIARPVIKGELRMFGLDDSISKEEVKSLLMEIGKCNEEAIAIGDIKPMRNGLGMIWAQCPLTLAIQMANLKTIRLGWSRIQIELLERRPVQCYKCWKTGHLKHACKSSVDRTTLCYRCGSQGHQVKGCNKDVNCVICKEEGYDAKHRVGSLVCINNSRRKNINKTDKIDHDSRKEKDNTEENGKMEITTNDDD